MLKVRVPATTANLGPGYDCMGMAVKLYNEFVFEEKIKDADNLIYRSMEYLFKKVGYKNNNIRIRVEGDVPQSRGLGSSATCIVGGLMGASIISGANLSRDEILELATEIEGHPDNVAPALLGGLVSSVYDKKVYYNRYMVSENLNYYFLIPNYELSTKESRDILPKKIPMEDAIFNMSRAILLPEAFAKGDFDRLKLLVKDRLHENYRKSLIYRYEEFKNAIEKSGVCTISGAGPTVFVVSDKDIEDTIRNILKELELEWDILNLRPDNEGAVYLNR